MGARTATTLRLTENDHGSGRIVVGDDWFGSVKTAVELSRRGLYFLGMVKVATRNYPIKYLKENCPQQRGATVTCKTRIDDIEIVAVAWRDAKTHTFVGTCGTTLEGSPCVKQRVDQNVEKYTFEVPQIKLVEEYYESSPSIDIHNHLRQAGLALNRVGLHIIESTDYTLHFLEL